MQGIEENVWVIPYCYIRPGEVHETVVNRRAVGKAIYSGFFDRRLEGVVSFSEGGQVRCYRVFNSFVNESGFLVLENATEFPLPEDKRKMAERILRERGIVER